MINKFLIYCIFIQILTQNGASSADENAGHPLSSINSSAKNPTSKSELAKLIYVFIDHFKQDDPIGIPYPIQDPWNFGEIVMRKGATLKMSPVYFHKISKFRIKNATIELQKSMRGSCGLTFEEVILQGNYTLRPFGDEGIFSATIKDLFINSQASLLIESSGKLSVQNIVMAMDVSGITFNFEKAFSSGILQFFTSSNYFFPNIKPKLIKDMTQTTKKVLDQKLEEFSDGFLSKLLPNSIGLIDFVIARGRNFVKKRFDPLKLDDIQTTGMFSYRIHDTKLFGFSSFYRFDDIQTRIENKTAVLDLNIGTQEVQGQSTWQVSLARGMLSRSGQVQFTIQHVKVNLRVSQPLDISKTIRIEDLRVELGNIQILSAGLGTFDYAIEFFSNTLPNLLRDQITEVIRRPLMQRIQQYADRFDAESFVKESIKDYLAVGSITLKMPFKNEL